MGGVAKPRIKGTLEDQVRQTRIFRAMARRTQSTFVSGVEFGHIFRDQTADGVVNVAEIVVWVGFRSGSRHPTPTYPGAHFTRGARRADFAKIAEALLSEISQAHAERIVRSLPPELDEGVIERLVRETDGKLEVFRGFLTEKEVKSVERTVSSGHLEKNGSFFASFHKAAIKRLLFDAVRNEVPRLTREVEAHAGKRLLTFVTQYGHAVSDKDLHGARAVALGTTDRAPPRRGTI